MRQGVILAAGKGSRIFPLSNSYPKPLLPVLNKPVIEYQIEAMRKAGIEEIIIVIGHLGQKIKDYFGNGNKFGILIDYVFDDDPQGIASSLLITKKLLKGPFAVFLGDIFMDKVDLSVSIKKMTESGADGIVIAKMEKDPELVKRNFAIVIDKDLQIIKVVEKPKVPPSMLKGYGLYLFNEKIFAAIEATPKSKLRNEYEITDSIQTFIDMGAKLYCDMWSLWDFNLSYPEDLLMCNLKMLKERGLKHLISQDAQVDKRAKIISSVIGDRAVVDSPLVLQECLVLPDTRVVYKSKPLSRQIFTGDLIFSV